MSLTSYRAAPPRVERFYLNARCPPRSISGAGWAGRPGGDLLSRALRRSTMGAGGFHGRVRDGIGCRPPAKATRSSSPSVIRADHGSGAPQADPGCWVRRSGNDFRAWRHIELYRAIRTSQLHALPRFHTWPINVMVYHGPQGDLVSRWVSHLDAFSGYPVRT
jgi:hypothetical protein